MDQTEPQKRRGAGGLIFKTKQVLVVGYGPDDESLVRKLQAALSDPVGSAKWTPARVKTLGDIKELRNHLASYAYDSLVVLASPGIDWSALGPERRLCLQCPELETRYTSMKVLIVLTDNNAKFLDFEVTFKIRPSSYLENAALIRQLVL